MNRKNLSFFYRLVCWTVLFLCLSVHAAEMKTDSGTALRLESLIQKTAERHGVDPNLVKAIIATESSFQEDRTGMAGEIGLMQIRECTVQDWASATGEQVPDTAELYAPERNLEIGTWCIARALRYWKDSPDFLLLALVEYNAGRTRLLEWMNDCNQDLMLLVRTKPSGKYAEKIYRNYFEYASHNGCETVVSLVPPPQKPSL